MVVIPNFANLGGNKHNKTISQTEKCYNTDSILKLLQEEVSILKHFFNTHFCICMTKVKLCSNKLCKSAFQKYLAKKKKRKEKEQKEHQSGHST